MKPINIRNNYRMEEDELLKILKINVKEKIIKIEIDDNTIYFSTTKGVEE